MEIPAGNDVFSKLYYRQSPSDNANIEVNVNVHRVIFETCSLVLAAA